MKVFNLVLEIGRDDGPAINSSRSFLNVRQDDENDSEESVDKLIAFLPVAPNRL